MSIQGNEVVWTADQLGDGMRFQIALGLMGVAPSMGHDHDLQHRLVAARTGGARRYSQRNV